jgi:hypothetical protein
MTEQSAVMNVLGGAFDPVCLQDAHPQTNQPQSDGLANRIGTRPLGLDWLRSSLERWADVELNVISVGREGVFHSREYMP